MNKLYLEQWAHMLLKNEPMTQKAFYNLTIIIKQCLEFSCEEGINVLKENPWNRVKINKKLFVKNKKPKSKTQVYSHSEQKLLIQAAKKSDAGEREIYLNSEARKIIAEVKKLNQTYNRYDDGYLFMNCRT